MKPTRMLKERNQLKMPLITLAILMMAAMTAAASPAYIQAASPQKAAVTGLTVTDGANAGELNVSWDAPPGGRPGIPPGLDALRPELQGQEQHDLERLPRQREPHHHRPERGHHLQVQGEGQVRQSPGLQMEPAHHLHDRGGGGGYADTARPGQGRCCRPAPGGYPDRGR